MSEVEVERYIAERSVSDASEAVEGGEVVNSENGSDP
jgi:hypothetical protein